jgi:hypothetical protein
VEAVTLKLTVLDRVVNALVRWGFDLKDLHITSQPCLLSEHIKQVFKERITIYEDVTLGKKFQQLVVSVKQDSPKVGAVTAERTSLPNAAVTGYRKVESDQYTEHLTVLKAWKQVPGSTGYH